jgi:hypothetical protein
VTVQFSLLLGKSSESVELRFAWVQPYAPYFCSIERWCPRHLDPQSFNVFDIPFNIQFRQSQRKSGPCVVLGNVGFSKCAVSNLGPDDACNAAKILPPLFVVNTNQKKLRLMRLAMAWINDDFSEVWWV